MAELPTMLARNLAALAGSSAAPLLPPPPAPRVAVADFAGLGAIAARNASLQQPGADETALAREKADAVRLWVELRRDGLSGEAAATQIAAVHAARFPLLKNAGKGHLSALAPPKGIYNLRRWEQRLLHGGGEAAALVRDYARGRRERRGDPRFWDILGSLYLQRNGPRLPEAYRATLRECRRQGIEDLPSYRQAAYWYEHCVDPAAIVVAREGEESLAERFEYFIRRDWDGVLVNDIWFGDHHDLDAPARVWDEAAQAWKPTRCTLTAWMDAKSLYLTGWQIAPGAGNNDRIQTALALGMIVAGMQAPRHLYTDNGSDYTARGFDTPIVAGGTEHSVLRQLGIATIHSLPYRAQAKVIERVFGIVCEGFSRHFAGYRGNSPAARTEKADYYWEHPEHLPTVEELSQAFAAWLADVYHRQPQHGCILGGRCPREVWDGRRDIRAPWSRSDLYLAFLMPAGVRTVGRGPSVAIDGEYYYAEELWPFCGAKGDAGKVLVKIDRYDREHVYCHHLDGRLICEGRTRARISALALSADERERIAAAERLKHQQRARAYTALAAETGGTWKLADPADRIRMLAEQLPAAAIERVGSRASVKGGSHRFTHYRLGQPGLDAGATATLPPAAPDAPEGPAVIAFRPTRADRDDAEIAAAHAAIVTAAGPSPDQDEDDLTAPIDAAMFAGADQ